MKVLYYSHTTSGGHRTYVIEFAEAIAQYFEVVVLTAQGADSPTSVRQIDLLPGPNTSLLGFRRIANRVRIYLSQPRAFEHVARAELRTAGADVCHFQELPTIFPAAMIARARRIGFRTVVTVHNVVPHLRGSRIERWKQHARVQAWRQADVLVVHSAFLADELARVARVVRSTIAVVQHPIWPVNDQPVEDVSSGYLFFGHLREGKGLFVYIQALALIGNPKASIIGSGSASTVAAIRGELHRLNLTNCTFRPEFVSDADIPRIFLDHEVLVAPYTHFMAQSGVTHLAAAYNLPTVVTDVGGLADLVRNYDVGQESPNTASDIAQAMLKAKYRASRGEYKSGFSRAREDRSTAALARKLRTVYLSLLEVP